MFKPSLWHHLQKIILLALGLTTALNFTCYAEAVEKDPSKPLSPYLFSTPVYTPDLPVREDPTIVRSRPVEINFNLLPDPE
ncbi:MAG: hypothetical protein F3745_01110 [Nitrospinae bacterium]|nr:hypothetical protein [Nitrospinota bacterium]